MLFLIFKTFIKSALHVNKFCKRAVRNGCTTHYMLIKERIRAGDKQLWGQNYRTPETPTLEPSAPSKNRILPQRGHYFILPDGKTVLLIDVFLTLSSISIFSLCIYLYFLFNRILVTFIINSHVCLWVMF